MAANDAANSVTRNVELTSVNGIGLWNSWTRNFKTPLLALFDLIDNAIDAPLHGGGDESTIFPGKIHIQPDFSSKFIMERDNVTGFYMINNSASRIKDIKKILEVYASLKGKDADSIGENGVGLKQGCATLSDMSLVLTRNFNEYSLGFMAAKLQRKEGVYLPSFKFKATPKPNEDDIKCLKPEMIHIFKESHPEVGECVKIYGNGDIDTGIERLLNHFQLMSSMAPWSEENNVFSVILHELKHGSKNIDGKTENTSPGRSIEETENKRKKKIFSERTFGLLDELAKELPRHYIHIPESFEIIVNSKHISFYHWQQRMVELSEYYLKIDKKNLYLTSPDWVEPRECDLIRVFCGFDPFRLGQSTIKSTCSLFIYSRQSGRLIKEEEDARAILNLNNSGTQFCQGLTLLVDDMQGYLPLNPTKQDIAFGEEEYGDTHKKNLYAWIGGVAHHFYNHNLAKCGKTKPKSTLSTKIQNQLTLVDQRYLKTLDQGKYTKFSGITWFKSASFNIRVKDRNAVLETTGKHTIKRLIASKSSPSPNPKPRGKHKIKKEDDVVENEQPDDYMKETPTKKRKYTRKTSAKKKESKKSRTSNDNSSETSIESDDSPISSLGKNGHLIKKIVKLEEDLRIANEKLKIESEIKSKLEERRGKLEGKIEKQRISLVRLKRALENTQEGFFDVSKQRTALMKKVHEYKEWEKKTSEQMANQNAQLNELSKCIEEMEHVEGSALSTKQSKIQSEKISMLEDKVKEQAGIISVLQKELSLSGKQVKDEIIKLE